MNIARKTWTITIPRQHPLRVLEWLIHFGMLLLLVGVFYHLWRQTPGFAADPLEGDPLQRYINLAGYSLALSFVVLYPRRVLNTALRAPLIWILIAVAILSTLWSDYPALTLRRSVVVIVTTLYGLALAIRFTFDEVLELLGWVFFTALSASLILVMLVPSWGEMVYLGRTVWRGVFTHKNFLGNYAALSLLIFSLLARKHRGLGRWFWVGGLGLAILIMIGAESSTALVLSACLLVGAIALHLLKRLHREWQVIFPVIGLFGAIAIVFLLINFETLLATLGKEITLTGRIPLWETLLAMGKERTWLGFGFNAFWLGWQGPSAEVWQVITWQPPHAHNGYLDTWLELGMLGLILTIVLFGTLFMAAFYLYTKSVRNASFWILMLFFLIILNFFESFLLRQHSFFWVLIVYASFELMKLLRSERKLG